MLFGKKKKEGSGLQAEVTRIPSGNKQGSFKKKTDLGQERYMGDIGSMETPKPKAEVAAPEPVKAPGNKRKTKTRKKKLIKGRKEKIAALKIPKSSQDTIPYSRVYKNGILVCMIFTCDTL